MREAIVMILFATLLGGCAAVVSDVQTLDMGVKRGQESQKVKGKQEVVDGLELRGDFEGEKLALLLQQSVKTVERYQVIRERMRETKQARATGAVEPDEVRKAARLGLAAPPGTYYLGQIEHPLYQEPQFKLFEGDAVALGREVGVEVTVQRQALDAETEELERTLGTELRPLPAQSLTIRITGTEIEATLQTNVRGEATIDLAPLMARYAAGLARVGKSWKHPALTVRTSHKGQKLDKKLFPPPSISFKYKKQHQARPLIQFCEQLAGKLIDALEGEQGTLVVVDLPLASGEVTRLGQAIGRWVGGKLQSSSKVAAVVAREKVRKALQEGGLEGTVSRAGARAIGQHLGARGVVIGQITVKPKQYEVKLTLFSCSSDVDQASVTLSLAHSPYLEKLRRQKGE